MLLPLLPLIFAILVSLFPLAGYLLALTWLNSRAQPTLLRGSWDFTAMLFGLSGFVFIAGPLVLYRLQTGAMRLAALTDPAELARTAGTSPAWLALWVLYFLGVLATSGTVLWMRRHDLVLYNVDRERLTETLLRLAERLGLEPLWREGRLFLFPSDSNPSTVKSDGLPFAPLQTDESQSIQRSRGVIDQDWFEFFQHLTLRWTKSDETLRRELEAGLRRELADLTSTHNPGASWCLTIAAALSIVLFFSVAVLLLLVASTRG